jgi:hypothetical protein
MRVGVSPRRANLVIYIMPGTRAGPELMSQLGTHRTGKSCLSVNRLQDDRPLDLTPRHGPAHEGEGPAGLERALSAFAVVHVAHHEPALGEFGGGLDGCGGKRPILSRGTTATISLPLRAKKR